AHRVTRLQVCERYFVFGKNRLFRDDRRARRGPDFRAKIKGGQSHDHVIVRVDLQQLRHKEDSNVQQHTSRMALPEFGRTAADPSASFQDDNWTLFMRCSYGMYAAVDIASCRKYSIGGATEVMLYETASGRPT